MYYLVFLLLLVGVTELLFFLFVCYLLFIAKKKPGDAPIFPPKLRTIKRKPKSVSEEEQWRKEQREAPMDPGF